MGTAPERLEEALVTRYPPSATIGLHRDAPAFGDASTHRRLRCPKRATWHPAAGRSPRGEACWSLTHSGSASLVSCANPTARPRLGVALSPRRVFVAAELC